MGKTLLFSKPQRHVCTSAKQLVLRFIYRKEAGAFVIRVFIFVFDDPVPVLSFLSFRGSIPSHARMMLTSVDPRAWVMRLNINIIFFYIIIYLMF